MRREIATGTAQGRLIAHVERFEFPAIKTEPPQYQTDCRADPSGFPVPHRHGAAHAETGARENCDFNSGAGALLQEAAATAAAVANLSDQREVSEASEAAKQAEEGFQ